MVTVSIKMFKICGYSACRPSEIIYYPCLEREKFSREWKKAIVISEN